MDSLHLAIERQRFQSEYREILRRMVAGAERWLAVAESCGAQPEGADELRREVAECRKELASFGGRAPAP